MTVTESFLKKCRDWTDPGSEEALKAIDDAISVARDYAHRCPHEDFVTARSVVYNTVAVAMLGLGQKPELDRLRSLDVTHDVRDPHPFTQALLVSLRRIRAKNPTASYILFCALKAIDAVYAKSPLASEWIAKTHLAAIYAFPSTFGSCAITYRTVMADVVRCTLA